MDVSEPGSASAPSEEPLAWLAPINGLFQDIRERWTPPSPGQGMEPIQLEPDVTWRETTDADREAMSRWFSFYEEGIHRNEATALTAADSLLSGIEIVHPEKESSVGSILLSFLVAASLNTECFLRGRWLRFTQEAGEMTPHSGGDPIEVRPLRGWNLQEATTSDLRQQIASIYPAIRRAGNAPPEHSFARAIGAYRVAVTSRFADVIPILLCAAMEALAADSNRAVVIRRLVPHYVASVPEDEASKHLEDLYVLRQWFAHSALIPRMRDAEVRLETLKSGLRVVKEILRLALADDSLLSATEKGVTETRQYLDK